MRGSVVRKEIRVSRASSVKRGKSGLFGPRAMVRLLRLIIGEDDWRLALLGLRCGGSLRHSQFHQANNCHLARKYDAYR